MSGPLLTATAPDPDRSLERVVLVEQSAADAEHIRRELRAGGVACRCDRVATREDLLAALAEPPDLILAACQLPGLAAVEVLRLVGERGLAVPVIVLTGGAGDAGDASDAGDAGDTGDMAANECLRLGAADYLHRDRLERLGHAARSAVERWRLRDEQRRAAATRSASEEQYRLLFAEAPHPMWVIDGETLRFLEVNERAVRDYGYCREELLAMTLADIRPPAGVPAMRDGVRRVLGGEVVTGRHLHHTKDGELREVSVASHPLVFAGRRALLAVIDDITERSRAEAALLESRARYRDLFGCITDAVIVTDLERQVVEVNPAFSRIFGYSMDEARGLHARSLYAEHLDFQKAGAMLDRIRAVDGEWQQAGGAGGAPDLPRTQVWRALCLHKSGRTFPVESSFSAMRSPAGQITGWVVVARDVTQRVWREDELRRSQQLLQRIVDGATAAIYVKDPGGRFLLVNERFAALVGRSAEEIVGQLDDDVYPPEISERFRAGDRQAIALRSAVEAEEEIVRDGAVRTYLAVRFPLFDPDGEIFALGGTATDVTDRKRLEMQLRQAQKMEAIGQLAGGVAHDFNNLLTAILGYTQLLALELKSRPDLLPHVEEVRRAGERAAALTRQLLAFSRDQVLQPRIVHLDAAVADVLTLLRRLIGEQIELITVLGAGPGRVLVDPGQVEQLIVNLAVNARDAMPEGGRLVIETAEVELDGLYTHHHPEARPGPYVRLTMSDTGHGMDAETRSHIFEPFFTTKPQGKGTGLGLSTVYGVVLQSGGQIEVYSEPGRGSSFKVYFPRAAAEAGDPVPVAAAGAELPSGSETVLLLEDEAPLRSLIRTVLESGGYTVLEEVGAEAALALARRHAGPIHLVLTDVVMPGMSGPDVAAQLAAVRPEARILFMSGYSGSVMGHRNILPPHAQLLEKPFTAEGLLQRVREVLGGGVPSREQEQRA